MEKKTKLVEIKKGQTGRGLLVEQDGYMSLDESTRKNINEAIDKEGGWFCPNPFVVSAVFQKFGIENHNGRIYPEDILKREVEKYQVKINERRAYGECYRPEAMILTRSGWKHLYEVNEGDDVLTLNTETNEIEVKPILRVIKKHADKLIHIYGRSIDDYVTEEHGYPIYNRNHKFSGFNSAKDILLKQVKDQNHSYIPKTGTWVGANDEFFTIPRVSPEKMSKNLSKSLREKYQQDLVIPMDTFAKFMGIYLSEGSHSKKIGYRVNIHQKKEDVCEEIAKMLDEWGIGYSVSNKRDGGKTFVISDMRLHEYVSQFGLCYDKFVPYELKQQSVKTLTTFYDWFVMGDGRIRGDKRRKKGISFSTDVFSTSEKLIKDLNEIQLKIGYSGVMHTETRDNDRPIEEGRIIKGENARPMHFTYKSLTKGVYLDERFIKADEVNYDGDVMCVEVENHVWYVCDNGKCHWTKNCNHPEDSVIDLGRICMNIIELHWEQHTLVGKLEIITSEAFRKSGLICCLGDTVANLLLSGLKIGVSSRAVGSVEQRFGKMIVGDDLELICWDVVSDPSTPGSFISTEPEGKDLQVYVESDNTKADKEKLFKKLDNFKTWLD